MSEKIIPTSEWEELGGAFEELRINIITALGKPLVECIYIAIKAIKVK